MYLRRPGRNTPVTAVDFPDADRAAIALAD
jgi:hypothetical protein